MAQRLHGARLRKRPHAVRLRGQHGPRARCQRRQRRGAALFSPERGRLRGQLHRRPGARPRARPALRARPGQLPPGRDRSEEAPRRSSTCGWAACRSPWRSPRTSAKPTSRTWECSNTRPCPAPDPKTARETGPAVSRRSVSPRRKRATARSRETARGPVDVPGLGDPNVRESNSVCVVDLEDPAAPKIEAFVRTGLPFGGGRARRQQPVGRGWSRADRVFVSNAHNDSITVIDAKTDTVRATDSDPHPRPGEPARRAADRPGLSRGDRTGCWWPKRASTPSA